MNAPRPPRLALLAIAVLALSQSFASAADPRIKAEPAKAQLEIKRDGLPNFFSKIKQGGEVKVAYFGGSITAANGWRVYTREWLSERFPNSKFTEIDAAIGGTGSDLGVYRLARDVLQYQPDLMFVEFSVNDGGATPENIWKAMEGIVRQTWSRLPHCEIGRAHV